MSGQERGVKLVLTAPGLAERKSDRFVCVCRPVWVWVWVCRPVCVCVCAGLCVCVCVCVYSPVAFTLDLVGSVPDWVDGSTSIILI